MSTSSFPTLPCTRSSKLLAIRGLAVTSEGGCGHLKAFLVVGGLHWLSEMFTDHQKASLIELGCHRSSEGFIERVAVWDAVAAFIREQLLVHKGVWIPTFGSFDIISKEIRTKDKTVTLCWPVFQLARNLIAVHHLKSRSEFLPVDRKVEALKSSQVAAATSVSWKTAQKCIQSTVSLLSSCLQNGKNVAVVLKDVGVLLIDGLTFQMKFYYDFLETLSGKENFRRAVRKAPSLLDMGVSRVTPVASLVSSGCLVVLPKFPMELVPSPPGLFQHKPRSVPVTSQDPPVLVTSRCRADLKKPPRGGAGAVGQRRTCRPRSAGGAGPASSCASGAAMQAQFASGTLTALQRVELLQQPEQVSSGWTGTEGPSCRLEGTLPTAWQQRAGCQRCSFPLPQAHEQMMEKRTAAARESLLNVAQQIRAERTAARKEELEQEKQLIAQLEEQLKAGSEEMEVLRREKQRLREEREELELEGAWQQHQMELEVERVPGAVLPELVEAQLEKKERARRRGLSFWMQTICLILVCLQLLLVAVLGSGLFYARHYDQELLYRLLQRVLPQPMYASVAYFASRTLRVVCDGLLPI
ncbi:uncharacterized protein [Excalfactoria chinensis]|uniref:uncharacterized protein isoform X1 n=1 Tax=Excalfactoria chinensis TaxID=46218 RepID=UPI003B3A2AB2